MPANISAPLAERMRPNTLDDLVGQEHLAGKGSILRTAIQQGRVPSMILWGPPGTGKTTIAHIIANSLDVPFYTLSAISSGVKDIREVIAAAEKQSKAILFIDEIHRFNKGQQDALLGAVEKGIVTLIGATTENPSFEVNSALLSRCQVYVLKPLGDEELIGLLRRVMKDDKQISRYEIDLHETEALITLSGGDARKLLNLFEIVVTAVAEELNGAKAAMNNALTTHHSPFTITITDDQVMKIAQQRIALYDKSGEQHYDIISAFIKSVRGSDPNGAVYWLARMIEGGEDVKFIARRLVILASEDIGNANPNALLLANSAFDAVNKIGNPEARIILAQCTTYLAASPKSNASYTAINEAIAAVQSAGDLPVPLHLRNSPTRLMKQMDYGKGYKYSHDYDQNFSNQEYLPEGLMGKVFYAPGKNAREEELRKYLRSLWGKKYGY